MSLIADPYTVARSDGAYPRRGRGIAPVAYIIQKAPRFNYYNDIGLCMAENERSNIDLDQSSSKATKVLEFSLGDETYCLDIDVIDEIVDAGDLTRVPNSPPHVEGVMDLRGRTTSIIDPKSVFDIEEEGAGQRTIVFDPDAMDDQASVAWVVDEVFQVTDIQLEDVDKTTTDDENIHGIVREDDRFVIWVRPDITTGSIESV